MKYDLVIFDLDGTLLDTLDDLADAANRALAEQGFPTRERDEIRRFVGNGVARLMRRAVPDGTPEEAWRRALEAFTAYYARNVNVRTRPYDGIPELLAALRAGGVGVAVNTNKPDAAANALIDAHFGSLVDMTLGAREDIPKKPAPEGARLIMDALGVPPGRALYVGDGDTDVLTAANAGIDGAWVSWGFRSMRELGDLAVPRAFDTPDALRRFILE